jgi:hypothetical protein
LAKQTIPVLWWVLSLGWLSTDKLIRDGDEEGHVGAAELFMGDLHQGDWLGFLERLWVGQMGEYPQAFSAGLGAWWWAMGGGDPGRVGVRAVCLFSLLITALATGRIARRTVSRERALMAEIAAMSTVLMLPLGNGLTRHFMPEGALMAAVSLAILATLRLTEAPSRWRGVQLGLILGLGMLTKQTFALLILAPILTLIGRTRRTLWMPLGLTVGVTLTLAGPWWVVNHSAQLSYTQTAVMGHGSGGIMAHLGYYPEHVFLLGLGPALFLVTILAAFSLWASRSHRGLTLGLAWLLGGLLILLFIPKKYPRLMAPLMPAAAVLIGAAFATLSKHKSKLMTSLSIAAALTLALASTVQTLSPRPTPSIDPGCPQIWLRPPSHQDLGLSAVAAALHSKAPGAVLIENDQPIPCATQTTSDWASHLGPWLRRAGEDREIHTNPIREHRHVISLVPGGGDITLQGLHYGITIRDTLQP